MSSQLTAAEAQELRQLAIEWRSEFRPEMDWAGYVVFYKCKASGWISTTYQSAKNFRPGCYAVPAGENPIRVAVGGGYWEGAKDWETVEIIAESSKAQEETADAAQGLLSL